MATMDKMRNSIEVLKLNNGKINEAFLWTLDGKTYGEIVGSVAKHYGITMEQATDELTDDEAENILEYLQGGVRNGCSALFQKWKLSLR
jgi:hypothetical protein